MHQTDHAALTHKYTGVPAFYCSHRLQMKENVAGRVPPLRAYTSGRHLHSLQWNVKRSDIAAITGLFYLRRTC